MAIKIKPKETNGKVGGNCRWCHETPFRRTVHLLDKLERCEGFDDIRRHLLTEFPHQAAEFHNAEIRSCESVRHNYKSWVEWQKNKTTSLVIARLQDWLEQPVKP